MLGRKHGGQIGVAVTTASSSTITTDQSASPAVLALMLSELVELSGDLCWQRRGGRVFAADERRFVSLSELHVTPLTAVSPVVCISIRVEGEVKHCVIYSTAGLRLRRAVQPVQQPEGPGAPLPPDVAGAAQRLAQRPPRIPRLRTDASGRR
ncbi:hypothetical protein INR49_011571 [Caranx melampygus]|nr:hypothetical protein INR49_011571 [Caranx melampygus]